MKSYLPNDKQLAHIRMRAFLPDDEKDFRWNNFITQEILKFDPRMKEFQPVTEYTRNMHELCTTLNEMIK